MVKNTDVFSCTTQVFLNCLRKGYLKLYEVKILMFSFQIFYNQVLSNHF